MARLPVVCVHGLTRNSLDFDRLAPWIAQSGRRVLALDVRGRGLSDYDPAADYRLPAYADDVARLLDSLGIARAIFVGTSMGGLITMEMASVRPGLVAGAVINDIGPELASAGLARIAGYVGDPPRFSLWIEAADHVRKLNGDALPHYASTDWDAMARRMFREDEGTIAPAYDPAIARPFGDAVLADDPWGRWNALAADRPILLLRGAITDLLDADVAQRMVEAGSAITLVEVPGVGHAPMLDEPAALSAIAEFLRGQP